MRRSADLAPAALGAGVLVGCVLFGAPPRMDALEGAPAFLARFAEALGPRALVLLCALAALGGVAWSGAFPLRGRDPAVRATRPLLLLALLAFVALLPLPAALVRGVAPFVGSTWDHVSGDGALAVPRTLSLWPDGTRRALLDLVCVTGAVAATFAAARGGRLAVARRVLLFVALLATAECGIGLLSTYAGGDTVLGVAKVSGVGRVTGTFVMAPMLGVWAGMGACAAAGLALLECVQVSPPRRAVVVATLAALLVCSAGALLSLARIMLAATALGLAVTAFVGARALALRGRRGFARALATLAWLVPAGGVAAAFAVPALRTRVDYLLDYLRGTAGVAEPRFAGWASTWDLFLHAPLLGTGLGSFGRAIHLTQSVDAPQELWFAHCEPLNLLSDVGVVGAVLALLWLVPALRAAWRLTRGADASHAAVAASCLGAATVVLVGGLADFQTQFLVVALPFAVLVTLPAALAAESTELPARRRPVAAVLVALLAFLVVGDFAQAWAAGGRGEPAGVPPGERLLAAGRAELAALRDAADPRAALADARATLVSAATRDPLHDAAHLWCGMAALQAYMLESDTAAADALRAECLAALGRARWVSRGHADVNLQIGVLYLDLLGAAPAPAGPPGDDAAAALREAGALVPQAFSRAWREALARELPAERLRALLPDRSYARDAAAATARQLRAQGRDAEADALVDGLDPAAPGGR